MPGVKRSKVEEAYGVPVPTEALFRWLAERYDLDFANEARAVYAAASRRYGRAAKLRADQRWLAIMERTGRAENEAVRQKREKIEELLKDPMGYIDGGE